MARATDTSLLPPAAGSHSGTGRFTALAQHSCSSEELIQGKQLQQYFGFQSRSDVTHKGTAQAFVLVWQREDLFPQPRRDKEHSQCYLPFTIIHVQKILKVLISIYFKACTRQSARCCKSRSGIFADFKERSGAYVLRAHDVTCTGIYD